MITSLPSYIDSRLTNYVRQVPIYWESNRLSFPLLVKQVTLSQTEFKEFSCDDHIIPAITDDRIEVALPKPANRLDTIGSLGSAQGMFSQMVQTEPKA